MKEQTPINPSDRYWDKAVSRGLKQVLFDHQDSPEHRNLGMTFEYLGRALLEEKIISTKLSLMEPRQMQALRRELTVDDYDRWQPRLPDAILFKRGEDDQILLDSMVEYKIANDLHMDRLQEQFDGFMNLADLLTHNNSQQGSRILSWALEEPITSVTKVPQFRCLYVTPQQRTSSDVVTTLGGRDLYREIHFPATTSEIRQRMHELQKEEGLPEVVFEFIPS